MQDNVIICIVIFIVTYIFIVSEKVNRTAVALFGAILMLIFNVNTQEGALETIDFNTLFLLIGMMIIVNIIKKTGFFEYTAIKLAKMVKGDPWKILIVFSIFTGASSAILDNVTTIFLVVPVTIVIAKTLELNPIPFLIPEALIANIGGASTLIGDPPNIMIGSAAGLGFNEFLVNLGPVIIGITIITLFVLKLIYKKKLVASEEAKAVIMGLNEKLEIKDKKLLVKSMIVLAVVIVGFLLHGVFGYESATVALFGASLLLIISKLDPEEVLVEVEWSTIFFFAGLFILVGSLEHVGVMEFLANKMLSFTQGDMLLTVMIILWGSAIASAFLDNIPFVAAMIPLIENLSNMSDVSTTPLWWALALGACLGGNGTMIGSSANVIVGGLLDKYGYKISFMDFMKIGFPIMIISILTSSVYIFFMYL